MKCVYALIRFLSHYLWSPLSYPCFSIPESSAIVTRSINSKGPFWSYRLTGCQHCPGQMGLAIRLFTDRCCCVLILFMTLSGWVFLKHIILFYSSPVNFELILMSLFKLTILFSAKRINMLFINTCMHGTVEYFMVPTTCSKSNLSMSVDHNHRLHWVQILCGLSVLMELPAHLSQEMPSDHCFERRWF